MTGSLQFVLVVAVLGVAGSAEANRPSYIGCENSDECGEVKCCVVGIGRYTYPSCKDLQSTGSHCTPPSANPVNLTVSYPDSASFQLTNVYEGFCPCKSGLSCDLKTATCQDTAA